MDRNMPGFPVCHQLPEHAQTHVHWVSDAIQWSDPLSSPSLPAFNLSQQRMKISHLFTPSVYSLLQLISHFRLFAIPWTTARQASLSITNSRNLPKFMSIESVMPSCHLILCCALHLLTLIPPSIRVFSNESTLHVRWPKYWSFRFSISPSNEHPGLISFRMDWLDLLAVQGTLKSLIQHYSSKASILWRSAFFTVQLSHPYMTTVKTIALTRQTFVVKVMSLLLTLWYYAIYVGQDFPSKE